MTDKKIVAQVKQDLVDSGVEANPAEIKKDVLTELSDELMNDVSGGMATIHLDSGHVDVVVT